VQEPVAPPPPLPSAKRNLKKFVIIGVAVVVLLGGGFFAYQKFLGSQAPVAQKPAVPKGANKAPGVTPAPVPSDPGTNIGHAPKQAIDKAQGAVDARNASGQTNIDGAAGTEPTTKGGTPKAVVVAPKSTTATTTIAPGVTATTDIDAAAEATAAFRSWVANAKLSSVVWGATPARAFINGRLVRAGDTVDAGLGIKFDGVNAEKMQLIFKDKSGATVMRRY
jgi:hypothetical protein